jgi:hypothetical protein
MVITCHCLQLFSLNRCEECLSEVLTFWHFINAITYQPFLHKQINITISYCDILTQSIESTVADKPNETDINFIWILLQFK